jgi:hypothetical protein
LAVLDKVAIRERVDSDWQFHLAQRDADQIRQYWYAQGYLGIKTEVIYTPGGRRFAPLWGVRSNIGPNGYPPRH